jgi:hypothetical protein
MVVSWSDQRGKPTGGGVPMFLPGRFRSFMEVAAWSLFGGAIGWLLSVYVWLSRIDRSGSLLVLGVAYLPILVAGVYGARKRGLAIGWYSTGASLGFLFGLWVYQVSTTDMKRIQSFFEGNPWDHRPSTAVVFAILGGLLSVYLAEIRRSCKRRYADCKEREQQLRGNGAAPREPNVASSSEDNTDMELP